MRGILPCLLTIALCSAPARADTAPATQPAAGSVSGTITAASGQLPEMIVYLEPADPRITFPAPQEPAVMSQKGAKFSPALLVICVGQAIEFRNDEDRPIEHNVFSRSPSRPFDLGLFPPPEQRTVVFDKPGPVKLFCSIHRYMDGMIYVCPTPFFAKVAQDGSFTIANVPPGEYRLRTWQRGARFDEQNAPVRVEHGTSATVNVQMKRG